MKPILFNTEMVKAILDGRKMQFRKTVKDKISLSLIGNYKENNLIDIPINNKYISNDIIKRSEYKVDDILYVKEKFCIGAYANDGGCETNGYSSETYISQCSSDKNIIYYADAIDECDFSDLEKDELPIWKPSVHLKEKDARIFLKVTNVKVERLQDITLTDMICEGINHLQEYSTGKVVKPFTQIKKEFINLWNSTAKDGYKWEDNPYVFIYEFERFIK